MSKKSKISYKEITKKKSKIKNSSFLNMNKNLVDELYLKNEKILESNIYVHRILANICVSLRHEQFFDGSDDYQYRLDLFDDEFLTNSNTGVIFRMNSYEICKGANYDALENALSFLEEYKKEWYSTINQKGETIKNYGGLIANPVYNKSTGGFQFIISAYWLEKLLNLGKYNQTYYQLLLNLQSSKHVIFWHWLSTLPAHGTKVNFKTLNERFGLDYSSARDLKKGFLRPIKAKFDKYSHESFNVSIKKEIIHIAKYQRNVTEFSIENKVSENDYERLKNRYKLSYVKKRHQLNDVELAKISSLIKLKPVEFYKSYELFISKIRKKKHTKATDIIGNDFIDALNVCLKEYYLTTSAGERYPNSYPVI